MIAADLRHIEHQLSMTEALAKAIAFLRGRDIRRLADGKVEIDGERVFAIVQRYETVKTGVPRFECHRKYIDVQYIASGEEVIGWAPRERMKITEEYDEGKDIAFGAVPDGKWTPVYLQAGQAVVLWPEDGHAPKLASRGASPVMKIVVKVAVER